MAGCSIIEQLILIIPRISQTHGNQCSIIEQSCSTVEQIHMNYYTSIESVFHDRTQYVC